MKVNTVSQAVGSTQARWFSVGPSLVRNINATATATAIDYAGSAVSDLPLIALLPSLGPVVLLPGNAEYVEQVVGGPGQIEHGGGELAEGVRTGRFDQAAEGFGEVCGGVGVLASVAVPLSASARAVRPLPRAPIVEKPVATLAAERPNSVGAAALRKYEASPKHPAWERGNFGKVSKAPKNGQAALENSVEVGDKTRVGIDYETGEFVVFNRTFEYQEIWHGHVREWKQVRGGTDPLNNQMRSALIKSERTTPNGKIVDAPQWAPEAPPMRSGDRR